MRRQISLWMGLSVLFTLLLLGQNGLAKETYKVQQGDTLFAIAQKQNVDVDSLKKANGLKGSQLQVNQVLVIPGQPNQKPNQVKKAAPQRPEFYTVRKGDSLAAIADKTGLSLAALKQINQLKSDRLQIGQRLALRDRREGAPAGAGSRSTAALVAEPDEEEEDGGLHDGSQSPEQLDQSDPHLGNWTTPEEPQLLAKVAMGFLGAPYRLGGSSVTGIDCSAFVKKIYQMFNIDLPRTASEQSQVGMQVPRNELTVGDLLFFKTRRAVGHVGIYVGNNEFVHASSRKRGVRVDNLDTPYYDKRFVRAVRLKELDGSL